jgi:hypothetical protein
MKYNLTLQEYQSDIKTRSGLILEKTINLAQAADTYDLFTATGDIYVEDINLYCTVVGATFTSVAIATDDTVPTVIMTDVEGAVANIVAGTNFQQATKGKTFRLGTGKKVQYTIVGDTGTGTMLATIKYRPISAGATLA